MAVNIQRAAKANPGSFLGGKTQYSPKELAELIVKAVDFEGSLIFDSSKPDGTPRKLMDISKINYI